MAQLVILGHKTRSKEVIEILEMLGGRNLREYVCNVPGYAYIINKQGIIDLYIPHLNSSFAVFTLEKFFEKYPYKVGDKVNSPCKGCIKTITSMEWDTYLNTVTYKLDNRIYTNIDQLKVVNDLQTYKEEAMEKINVAKLLKDCPQGMELNCTVCDECILDSILEGELYPIKIRTPEGAMLLTKYGSFSCNKHSKCIIFPKGKTTWEGFHRPFMDGDIVAIDSIRGTQVFIFKEYKDTESGLAYCYVMLDDDGTLDVEFYNYYVKRFATEGEKEKLFKAIKDNGYKWNPETKELEKLIQPQFKAGDWITDGVSTCQIYSIDDTQYWYSKNCILGSIESVDKLYHIWTIEDAKDGDVLFHSDSASNGIFIFKEILQCGTLQKVICYCDYDSEDGFCLGENHTCCWTDSKILRPATEERRNRLFQKMKEAGYKWNAETKTLEKLSQPKFKVGDKVLWNYDTRKTNTISNVTLTENRGYVYWIDTEGCSSGWWGENELTPIPNKFDISTLIPFESRVLARYCKDSKWIPTFWGSYDKEDPENPYNCCGMLFAQCIPYEGNEYLLNTADDCDEYFKTWQ